MQVEYWCLVCAECISMENKLNVRINQTGNVQWSMCYICGNQSYITYRDKVCYGGTSKQVQFNEIKMLHQGPVRAFLKIEMRYVYILK